MIFKLTTCMVDSCGNGVCDDGYLQEDCRNCPQDCGACPAVKVLVLRETFEDISFWTYIADNWGDYGMKQVEFDLISINDNITSKTECRTIINSML